MQTSSTPPIKVAGTSGAVVSYRNSDQCVGEEMPVNQPLLSPSKQTPHKRHPSVDVGSEGKRRKRDLSYTEPSTPTKAKLITPKPGDDLKTPILVLDLEEEEVEEEGRSL